MTDGAPRRWVQPVHLSVSDILLIYVLSAFGALAFFVWLAFQILRLMRPPGEDVELPRD